MRFFSYWLYRYVFLIDIKTQEALIFLSNRVHPVDHRAEYLICRDEIVENF